jgi:hypothetical protein
MSSKIRNLFYIPTWAVVFLALASAGALIVDLYMLFTLDSFTSITIDGIEYVKGTEEFRLRLHELKRSFFFSALLALVISLFTSRAIYKRKNNPRKQ